MTAIQVLIAAFVLFAIWRTVGRFREAELRWPWFIVWLLMWVVLGIGALLPQTTEWFARIIGVGRGVDAALYASVIFLFYLEFRLYLRQERLEHEISVLVRQIGLEDFRQREAASQERAYLDE